MTTPEPTHLPWAWALGMGNPMPESTLINPMPESTLSPVRDFGFCLWILHEAKQLNAQDMHTVYSMRGWNSTPYMISKEENSAFITQGSNKSNQDFLYMQWWFLRFLKDMLTEKSKSKFSLAATAMKLLTNFERDPTVVIWPWECLQEATWEIVPKADYRTFTGENPPIAEKQRQKWTNGREKKLYINSDAASLFRWTTKTKTTVEHKHSAIEKSFMLQYFKHLLFLSGIHYKTYINMCNIRDKHILYSEYTCVRHHIEEE